MIGIGMVVAWPGMMQGQDTWRRTYGALADDFSVAFRAVAQDRFIAVGNTGSFGQGSSDIYLLGVDGLGAKQWSATIGGAGLEQARDMRITSSGDPIIAGFKEVGAAGGYDGMLVLANDEGQELWQRTYGGSDWDLFHQVRVMPDGGFLIAGQTYNGPDPGGNAWMLRTNASGDVLWERTIGGSGEHEARTVHPLDDGGYVMAGSFPTGEGHRDGFVARYDAAATLLWLESYGGDSLDLIHDILPMPDGGFSFVGTTRSQSPFHEAWHVRLDADGAVLWSRNWGQINDQESREHRLLDNGDFITIGYTKTSGGGGKDMFLMRNAPDGDFVFGRTFGGLEDDEGFGLDELDDGFICGGHTYSYGVGGADVFLVRTNVNGQTATETVISGFDPLSTTESMVQGETLRLHPNPTTGRFTLSTDAVLSSVRLWDGLGREAHRGMTVPGQNTIDVDLPSGAYTVEAMTRDGRLLRTRLIIVRP